MASKAPQSHIQVVSQNAEDGLSTNLRILEHQSKERESFGAIVSFKEARGARRHALVCWDSELRCGSEAFSAAPVCKLTQNFSRRLTTNKNSPDENTPFNNRTPEIAHDVLQPCYSHNNEAPRGHIWITCQPSNP